MEECALRNLIDNEQMAKDTINDAVARGFSLDTVKEMAMHMSFLVDINTLGNISLIFTKAKIYYSLAFHL